jgi:GLPGLI family protein
MTDHVIMIRLLAFLFVLFPLRAAAQSGVILFDHSVQLDFEMPERPGEMRPGQIPPRELPPAEIRQREMRNRNPTARISSMLLLFNESASLMVPAPTEEEERQPDPLPGPPRMMRRPGMGLPSRSGQETLLEAYVKFENDSVVETRDFMGRTFLMRSTRPAYEWRLSAEHSEVLGYLVQKATALLDSTVIEAWFTPEIPVSAGPGLFGGLPGMILSVSVDSGHSVYSAAEINLTNVDAEAIKEPDEGQEMSRDEYEQIVAEKLEELRMQMRGRRRRP